MLQCTPFLLFDGTCAEAMTFYHQCLGGELTLTKLGETPMKDQFPPEKHNRIINAHLKSSAIEFSATDWMASPALEPKQGEGRVLGNLASLGTVTLPIVYTFVPHLLDEAEVSIPGLVRLPIIIQERAYIGRIRALC